MQGASNFSDFELHSRVYTPFLWECKPTNPASRPIFVTNAEKMVAELEDPYILMHEKKAIFAASFSADFSRQLTPRTMIEHHDLSGRRCRRPRIQQRATIDQHRVPPFRHRQRRHRASHGLWRDALHPGRILETFKEEFGQDITDLWDADDISIENFTQSLHRDVRSVRTSRGTPRHVNVFGFLYDIETGQLLLVEEKPGDPTAPRGAPWR